MTSPWQVSAALCIASVAGAFIFIPLIAKGNAVLTALVPIGRLVLGFFAVAFGAIAIGRLLSRTEDGKSARMNDSRAQPRGEPGRHKRAADPAAPKYADFTPRARAEPTTVSGKPTAWSLDLLQSLDWKRFEEVVAAYFRESNFRCETISHGPDGGVDARLYFGDQTSPVGVVQCKAWGSRQVGVAPVRELLGVMAHENVKRGYFAATGVFSDEAIRFAAANPIRLISGRDFLAAVAKMDADRSAKLLALSTEGDYTTPTCASCGQKLYRKTFRNGGAAWVCHQYPKCRTMIRTKA